MKTRKQNNWRGCYRERREPLFPGMRISGDAAWLPFAIPGDYGRLMTVVYSEPQPERDEEGALVPDSSDAPLAGLVFVLEELSGNFTPVVFVAAFLASVTADVVGRVVTGEMAIFPLHEMTAPTVHTLPAALVLGAFCGLGGVVFNRCLLKSLDLYALLRWPGWAVGALAGGVVGLASGIDPSVGGSGGLMAERALMGEIAGRYGRRRALWTASAAVLPQQNGACPATRQAGQPPGSWPCIRRRMAVPVLASYRSSISAALSGSVTGTGPWK